MIENYTNNNGYQTQLFEYASLNRFNRDGTLTKPIEIWEIKVIINNFKNEVPGESGITKLIMQKPLM